MGSISLIQDIGQAVGKGEFQHCTLIFKPPMSPYFMGFFEKLQRSSIHFIIGSDRLSASAQFFLYHKLVFL